MKHGLPKTAKIRMAKFVETLSIGETFTARDITNYVNEDGRLDMTPKRVSKWCSSCPYITHINAGEWQKVSAE